MLIDAVIRVATQRDIEKMQALLKALPRAWHPAALADCFGSHYRQFVMETKNKIIGFMTMRIAPEHWEIMFIAVDPHFQRQQVATTLLRYLIAEAKEAHIKSLQLEVRRSNHAALALYQQCGFIQVGTRKGYYFDHGKREDALLLDFVIS